MKMIIYQKAINMRTKEESDLHDEILVWRKHMELERLAGENE